MQTSAGSNLGSAARSRSNSAASASAGARTVSPQPSDSAPTDAAMPPPNRSAAWASASPSIPPAPRTADRASSQDIPAVAAVSSPGTPTNCACTVTSPEPGVVRSRRSAPSNATCSTDSIRRRPRTWAAPTAPAEVVTVLPAPDPLTASIAAGHSAIGDSRSCGR